MLTDFQKFTDVGIRGPLTQLKIWQALSALLRLEDCAISCASYRLPPPVTGKIFCTFKRFGANAASICKVC